MEFDQMSGEFARDYGAIDAVFALLERFFSGNEVEEAPRFAITLAVEELFTNMVKYNRDTDTPVQLHLRREGNSLSTVLIDPDSRPFDVTEMRQVDVKAGIEQRRPGGLGIFLVHQLMDEVRYDFRDGETRITLIKSL